MAADEALLRNAAGMALLRNYAWKEPSWSMGCLQPVADLAKQRAEGRPLVRRLTGGGAVSHGPGELTFSLIVPASHPMAAFAHGLEDRYKLIHGTVAAALRDLGIEATLVGPEARAAALGGHCFENPVRGDVVDASGRKLAGGAQRRTREGVLHQGSIACDDPGLAGALAHRFAGWEEGALSTLRTTDLVAEESVGRLVSERYELLEWLERR